MPNDDQNSIIEPYTFPAERYQPYVERVSIFAEISDIK